MTNTVPGSVGPAHHPFRRPGAGRAFGERPGSEGGCDLAGPQPVAGKAEEEAPARGDGLAGRGEQAEPQVTRFAKSRPADTGEHGHPGQQIERHLDDLQPDLILRGVVRGKVSKPGGPGGPDPALRAGPQPLTELKFGDSSPKAQPLLRPGPRYARHRQTATATGLPKSGPDDSPQL
jgi:hypothetical protein